MKNDYGLNPIDRRDLLIVLFLLVLSVPISLFAINLPEFRDYYLSLSITPIAIFSRLFGMFLTELFFRGILLFRLAKKIGKWSIIIQDITYTILHVSKPLLEIPFSGAVGLLFGKINYRNKSFLPSFLLHAIGSEMFIIMIHLL